MYMDLLNAAITDGYREDTVVLSEFDLRIREGKHSGFNDCPSPRTWHEMLQLKSQPLNAQDWVVKKGHFSRSRKGYEVLSMSAGNTSIFCRSLIVLLQSVRASASVPKGSIKPLSLI